MKGEVTYVQVQLLWQEIAVSSPQELSKFKHLRFSYLGKVGKLSMFVMGRGRVQRKVVFWSFDSIHEAKEDFSEL
jgi:hypothetical protein